MAMPLKLIGSLLIAASLTACGSGAKLTATPSSLAGAKQSAEQSRLLAEGVFTLPSTLVSVGSGSLVSVGSGHIVSTGSAMFRVQSLSMVPVADAVVALRRPNGAKVPVNAVVTDAQGRYRLMGAVSAGAYRLEATHAGQAYMTLANVSHFGSVDAPIDVATTLVSARLLAAQGDLEVLAAADFQAVVALVRTAVEAQGLPAGWTPAQAAETLATLEAATPALKQALGELETAQVALDARVTAFDYRLQSMAEELGIPASSLAAEARAILARNPEATESEVADAVRENRSSGQAGSAPAATPKPAAPSPAPDASPSAAPTATPAVAPTPSPAASGTPAAAPTPKPTATPAPGGNKGNNGKGNGNGNNGNGNNGNNGNGNGGNSGVVSAPTPSATPTAAPTAAPTATPAPVASKTPCPTPTPTATPAATPTPTQEATETPDEEVGPPPGYDHKKWQKLYEKWKHKWKDHWNDHDKDED